MSTGGTCILLSKTIGVGYNGFIFINMDEKHKILLFELKFIIKIKKPEI